MEPHRVEIPLSELKPCQSLDEWKDMLTHHGVPLDGDVVEWIDVARQVHVFEFFPAVKEQA